jgi:hypothetical protein
MNMIKAIKGPKKIECAKNLPYGATPRKNNPLSTMSGNNAPIIEEKIGNPIMTATRAVIPR